MNDKKDSNKGAKTVNPLRIRVCDKQQSVLATEFLVLLEGELNLQIKVERFLGGIS